MGLQQREQSRVRAPRPQRGWRLGLYVDAGEVGGSFRYSWDAPRKASATGGDRERSRAEAARRARSKLRRYCAANRLNRLGTLTYRGDGCHDPYQVRQDVGGFFRELRVLLGQEAFPYAWVPEPHPGGHGFHVHFGVGRYVRRGLIERAWGRGHVHIKLLGHVPAGSGTMGEARVTGGYLGKYVGKSFEDDRIPGLHRYEVAQGFQPIPVKLDGPTLEEALDRACGIMGGAPARVWHSDSAEDWRGPPAVWAAWQG